MHVTEVDDHIFLIDLKPVGIENFIASYVIKGQCSAIIETGPASTVMNLLSGLKELEVRPEEVVYVAVSHIHLDHGGGAGILLSNLPKARLIVHKRGAPHLSDPQKLWNQSQVALGSTAQKYGRPIPVPEDRIIVATDGMTIKIGNDVKLKVVETLGHASHHLAYHDTSSRGIFTGDSAGIYLNEVNMVVPTTPSPFRLDIALSSLEKLASLEPKVLYYSHFGKADDAIGKLQAYRNRLKLWARTVKLGVDNGESTETISRRILQRDVTLQEAEEHIKANPILSRTVFHQSIEGIAAFAKEFRDLLE